AASSGVRSAARLSHTDKELSRLTRHAGHRPSAFWRFSMKKRLLGVASAALLLSALAVGCSDRMPSAPSASPVPTQQSNSLLGGLLGGVIGTVSKLLNIVVTLVERPTALSQDVVWSF